MDKRELKEKTILTSFFQGNSKAYFISLCSTLFELWYTLSILDVIEVNYMMGIITFVNIALLFALFTAAVKIKVYSKKWAINTLIVGIYAIFRALFIIPLIIKPYQEIGLNILLNLILGALLITSGLLTLKIINERKPYINEMEHINE
ncbi:MAG: hypothetical protein ACPKM0_08335 [Pleomorphochaeta sp.]